MNRSPKEPEIVMIRTDRVLPNDYNPNRKSEEEYEQHRAEVRRLGQVPKPLIVTRHKKRQGFFTIIDGEHSWRAAVDEGYPEVPCEIWNVDLFESMRQTRARNQVGKPHPVREGRMFQRMKKLRNLSTRGLAKEIGIPESTIRNALDYAQAASVRSKCTGTDCTDEIAGYSQREISMYMKLPEEVRDAWLDAGADPYVFEGHQHLFNCSDVETQIVNRGLAFLLTGKPTQFRRSVAYAWQLADWRQRHFQLPELDNYVLAVAKRRLPVWVLDLLPRTMDDGKPQALLSPQEWEAALADSHDRAKAAKDTQRLVSAGIRAALRKAGHDPATVCGPEVAEMLAVVEKAPDFVKKAEHLSLSEQAELTLVAPDDGDDVIYAKELTCDYLQLQRGGDVPADSPARLLPADLGPSILDVYRACLDHVEEEWIAADEEALFADEHSLFEAVLNKLQQSEAICHGQVDGKPASEILAERLDSLDWPEFKLLASFLLVGPSVEHACRRWVETLTPSSEREE